MAEAGDDPGALDFDDYYPALAEHYRASSAEGLAGAGRAT